MLVRSKNVPRITTTFEAMVVWLDEAPMQENTRYIVRHTTREVKGFISRVEYKIDIHTLGRTSPGALAMNEIGRLAFTTTAPIFIDPYQKNRATGNLIVIDPITFRTVAAGMVIDRGRHNNETDDDQVSSVSDLHREGALVTQAERELRSGRRAVTFWMTGLSGSGKSTIAKEVERSLFDAGVNVFFLDGDNMRHGLSKNLGFSREDRSENLRRAAEVAALFNQAGVTVICAFISPYEEDRMRAREIIGSERFLEVHVTAPLEVCESRDPHGLYQKARRGEVSNFTGVSDPYEPPQAPHLTLDTSTLALDECIRRVLAIA
jgi:bifunctional enzyme CysN/CysC